MINCFVSLSACIMGKYSNFDLLGLKVKLSRCVPNYREIKDGLHVNPAAL